MEQKKNTNKEEKMGKGLSIASMVCGIIALVFSWTIYIGLVCGLIALVLGIIALVKKSEGKGMAIAGVATSAVGLVTSVLILILGIIAVNTVIETVESGTFEDTWTELEDWSSEMTQCLEEHNIDPELDYDNMTEAQQDAYWECF